MTKLFCKKKAALKTSKAPQNNHKSGFILAYSVAVMACVLFLIAGVMSVMGKFAKDTRAVTAEFKQKTAVVQIEDYLVLNTQESIKKARDLALDRGYTLNITQDDSSNKIYTLTYSGDTLLFIKISSAGKVIERHYHRV